MRRRDARPYQEEDAPFWVLLLVVLGVFALGLLMLWVIQPYLS